MTEPLTTGHNGHRGWVWPLIMSFIRLPLALIGTAIAIFAYQVAGNPVGIAAGLGWSTLTVTVVNVISLALLAWRSRVERFQLSDAIGFDKHRLPAHVAWGLVWSLALGGLLLVGIFLTGFVIYGTALPNSFEDMFVGNADFAFDLPVWLALISAVAFPLLTPVVEELQYRGYAQRRLIDLSGGVWRGILIPAVGFGLQHLVFAVTFASGVAYTFGFFLWGFGAGLIAHRQNTLVPLIIAHFLSNLSFGIIPLFFIFGTFPASS